VADNEHYPSDPYAGMPRISAEAIEAYKNQPHDAETDFNKLKRDNPALARELADGIVGIDPRFLELSRAFVMGALFMYHLVDETIQVGKLEQLLKLSPSIDGDDDEGQPL
jgi:hypothetical protein